MPMKIDLRGSNCLDLGIDQSFVALLECGAKRKHGEFRGDFKF